MFTRRILDFIYDLLFPIECFGCGQEGKWLCAECFQKIPINTAAICPFCRGISPLNMVCPRCQRKFHLDGIWIASDYENEVLQEMIKALKYRFAETLEEPLGRILINFLETNRIFANFSDEIILAPVPLHRRRFLERGFNQASLLSEQVSNHFHLPLEKKVLERCRYTMPQVDLEEAARQTNIAGAFLCRQPEKINKKIVILTDDVLTTGATMEECAKALKQSGAKQVWGLALAKG